MSNDSLRTIDQNGAPLPMSTQHVIDITDTRRISAEGEINPRPVPVPPTVSFIAYGDKVVCWRLPAETVSAGGIQLADIAVEKPLNAIVVAVSPHGTSDYTRSMLASINVGDKVMLSRHTGTEVEIDGNDLTIVSVHDILVRF